MLRACSLMNPLLLGYQHLFLFTATWTGRLKSPAYGDDGFDTTPTRGVAIVGRKLGMDGTEWDRRYYDDTIHEFRWNEQVDVMYKSLPEVAISAFTETRQAESSIPVPKQRSYAGRRPVIPSSLADTPCARLGVTGLLEKLMTILGTSYEEPSISSLLETYIARGYDFGTAYARLRRFWYFDLSNISDELRTREARDGGMRRDVLVNNKIVSYHVPARRVWDLYSNRVVSWSVAHQWPWGISHAWVEEEGRADVMTPINGYEWPVPIPKDANLDLIRIEMLNLGAEYVWLDVLCLRQAGGQREDLRMEEWKVDVPTIGYVYRWANQVVCYFSGLGRPFRLKGGDLESDRCWFRRAWTLQEINRNPIIGGDTGDDKALEEEMRARFEKEMSSLRDMESEGNVFDVLAEMQKRISTNPVDKISGLVYLLYLQVIPAYSETQSLEDAWTALVGVLWERRRADLFFGYPNPGNGSKYWRPSWRQVMTEVLPSPCLTWLGRVERKEEINADWYEGPCIESGYVRRLAQGSLAGKRRMGELVVEDNTGVKHTFKVTAEHQYSIPEGLYTLLGSPTIDGLKPVHAQNWVVGRRVSENMFQKMSVFEIPDPEEVKRLYHLGVAIEINIFLV
ncbi:uncharacterized protein BT62DRAFT_974246 [Guyanagaster necrorhizus]|uniref:Heterokaryon incompatibility domain-containing protein n=1 Tax=Guyanagaster necrorhizus TaxID=856835 RepID=A0A9P7VJ05_9AGAR|nr:uncharacterized protein BT62DRAFT_974246 [Guyanagaster necrorhizus MCA 3950]KAG7441991.1 hypothetical protein BT62DRAFT_974246 [Guyanagaster necrorhizus MCA 3950]